METIEEGSDMATGSEPPHRPRPRHVSIEELARRQGIQPPASLDELACPGLWASDDEYEQFLADWHASRQSGMA